MTQVPIARGSHAVRFFETEESAYRTIAEFFSEDARLDDCCIMLARAETLVGTQQVLTAHPATQALADRIQFIAAGDGLAQFVIGNQLDRERTEAFCLRLLSYVPTSGRHARVRLYAETADVLCERGQHAIALLVENFAGLLFTLEPRLSILCGYSIRHFDATHAAALRAVCSKHTDVGPLPVVPGSAGASGEKAAIPGGGASPVISSRVVYVVDDDASMRRSIGRLLTVSSFRACLFDSAEAFLRDAAAFSDGCLVLDIQLGGMTGLELIPLLAQRGVCLPVIAMSGFLDEKTESEALRLGAHAFLHKPFEPKVLLDAIERAMR